MKLKSRTTGVIAGLVALFAVPQVHATLYTVNATVAKVYSMNRESYPTGSPDHFTLTGFSSAGSCPTNDGLVAIHLPDNEGGKRQLAIVLMARAMALTLHARVDDSRKNSGGGCLLQVLEIEK